MLRPLLHPVLCQLKGKVIPAAWGHPRFLIATTKLQENTADGISLILWDHSFSGPSTAGVVQEERDIFSRV